MLNPHCPECINMIKAPFKRRHAYPILFTWEVIEETTLNTYMLQSIHNKRFLFHSVLNAKQLKIRRYAYTTHLDLFYPILFFWQKLKYIRIKAYNRHIIGNRADRYTYLYTNMRLCKTPINGADKIYLHLIKSYTIHWYM